MSTTGLMRGTFILSIAIFISKLIGMFFTIPFNAIVGKHGVYLYGFAYTPYAIILSISTVGVPLAVSKFVARYNAMGDYLTGKRLFRSGLLLMIITGIVGFLVMYIEAPTITILSGVQEGNTFNHLVLIIRVLSFALIIVPSMSLIRGYFQGFEMMGPTALSQTIEQVVRISFGLIGAFFIVKIMGGSEESKVLGVAFVTFGAFLGAIAGLITLIKFWIKRKSHFDRLEKNNKVIVTSHPSIKLMYKELFGYAIPFVCVGLANQLFLQIDQFTLNHFLHSFHKSISNGQIELIITCLMTLDQKLVMIPVSLSTALALTIVPTVSSSYTLGEQTELKFKITQALQLTLFMTIPAAMGLSALSHMIYGFLYSMDDIKIGGEILRWYSPSAVLFAVFSITAAILQGVNRQKVTILSLCVGILFKLILNPVFINWFSLTGSIWATDIGYTLAILINLVGISMETGYNYTFIAKRFLLILIFSSVMVIGVITILLLNGNLVPSTKIQASICTIIGVLVGGTIYTFLSLYSGLAKQVLGKRFKFFNH